MDKILTHNPQQTQQCAYLPMGKLIVFGLFVTLLFSAQTFAQRVTTIDSKGTRLNTGNIVSEGTTAPTNPTPIQGDVWFDTTSNLVKTYNGSTWKTVASFDPNDLKDNQNLSVTPGDGDTSVIGLENGSDVTIKAGSGLSITEDTSTRIITLSASATGTGTGTDDQKIDDFSLSGSQLSLSLEDDGEAPKTVDLSPAIAAGETDTSLAQDTGTGVITYTAEDGQPDKANVVSADSDNIVKVGTDGGAFVSQADLNEPWFGTDDNAGATQNDENIYHMGQVGIGTTTPEEKLHVEGRGRFQGAGADNYLEFGSNTGHSFMEFGGGKEFTVWNKNAIRLTIADNTGNVGIGIYPTEKLDVNGRVKVRTLPTGLVTDDIVVVDTDGVLKKVAANSEGLGTDDQNLSVTPGGDGITSVIGLENGSDVTIKAGSGLSITEDTSTRIITLSATGTGTGTGTDDQKIDDFSLSGSQLSLSLEDDGEAPKTVDLSPAIAAGETDTSLAQDTTTGIITYTAEDGQPDKANVVSADSDNIVKVGTDGGALVSQADLNEPWFGTDDNAGATQNDENIYHMGQVGIGTSSPQQKLHVEGRGRFQGAGTLNYLEFGSNTGHNFMEFGGGKEFTVWNKNAIRLTIADNTGNVGIGIYPTEKLDVNGSVKVRALPTGLVTDDIVVVDTDGVLKKVAANDLGAADGDAWGVTGEDQTNAISRTGDVGIGTTTSPSAKLHVNGNAYVQNEIRVGSNVGDVNQTGIIKQNGSIFGLGLFTWGDTAPVQIGGGHTIIKREYGGNANLYVTGSVGIGTETPMERLHVEGRGRFQGAAGTDPYLELGSDPGNSFIAFGGGKELTVWNEGGAGATLTIADITGNVGIGTRAPAEKLDVNGRVKVRTLPNGLPTDEIVVADSNGVLKKVAANTVGNDGDAWGVTGEDQTNAISRTGHVGIGRTNPQQKLHVQGKGRFQGAGTNNFIDIGADGNNSYLGFEGGGPFNIWNKNIRRLTIQDNTGNVGINNQNPTEKLHVDGNGRFGDAMIMTSSFGSGNQVHFKHVNSGESAVRQSYAGKTTISAASGQIVTVGVGGAASLTVDYNGRIAIKASDAAHVNYPFDLNVIGTAGKTNGGTWDAVSDRRAKTNINTYTAGLDEILKIKPITFNYLEAYDDGRGNTYVGVIAQEIEEVLPNTVTKVDYNGIKDFRHFNASELTFTLINAIQELKAENEELKARIEALENK